jgi:hypothetical protein
VAPRASVLSKQAEAFCFLAWRRDVEVFSFLTPGVFDVLVLLVITVGILAAARRIYQDFQRGPRWPASSNARAHHAQDEAEGEE